MVLFGQGGAFRPPGDQSKCRADLWGREHFELCPPQVFRSRLSAFPSVWPCACAV